MSLPANFFQIGKAFVEGYMVDRCRVTRDKPGVRNDVLDPDTLELVPTAGEDSTIFEGICLMKPLARKDMSFLQGDQAVFRKVYQVMVPQDADHIEIGDTLLMISVTHDSTLNGEEFRVMENRYSTHSTYRFLMVEDIQQDYNSTNPTT